jgi:hypothetical protein
MLPTKDRTLAGVTLDDAPLFDLTVERPLYKIGLILSIYDHVSDSDHVEIVGFGRGVSTTHILRAGAGTVTGYEGAANMITKGKKTVARNYDGTPSLDVRHAVVGESIDVYGDQSNAQSVHPSELSDADVLVLDCEGAEISILENLGTNPQTILCESHPSKEAPVSKITSAMGDRYTTTVRKQKPRTDAKSVVIGQLDD